MTRLLASDHDFRDFFSTRCDGLAIPARHETISLAGLLPGLFCFPVNSGGGFLPWSSHWTRHIAHPGPFTDGKGGMEKGTLLVFDHLAWPAWTTEGEGQAQA